MARLYLTVILIAIWNKTDLLGDGETMSQNSFSKNYEELEVKFKAQVKRDREWLKGEKHLEPPDNYVVYLPTFTSQLEKWIIS